MKDAIEGGRHETGREGFWFWLSLAAYNLADFFYMGVKSGSFGLEWSQWRSLFQAVVFAGMAHYFRSAARRSAG